MFLGNEFGSHMSDSFQSKCTTPKKQPSFPINVGLNDTGFKIENNTTSKKQPKWAHISWWQTKWNSISIWFRIKFSSSIEYSSWWIVFSKIKKIMNSEDVHSIRLGYKKVMSSWKLRILVLVVLILYFNLIQNRFGRWMTLEWI